MHDHLPSDLEKLDRASVVKIDADDLSSSIEAGLIMRTQNYLEALCFVLFQKLF